MIDRGKGPADPSPEKDRKARFEATLHRGERHVNLKEIPALGLDRVPGAAGEVRVLMSLEDAARLVEMGFEVRMLRAHPTRPLDAALIPEDEAAHGWLEERVRGIERKGGS